MDILVISDSHGSHEELKEVINRHQTEVQTIFHCGDSELPGDSSILKDTLTVQGNCDLHGAFPEDIIEEVNGIRLYVTHGHLYNVKMTYVPLSYRAEEKGARLACFGHSHVAHAFEENGVIFVNPGSLLLPRNRPEQTYAIVTFYEERQVRVSFRERRTGKEIPDLCHTFAPLKSKNT